MKFLIALVWSVGLISCGSIALAQDGMGSVDSPAGAVQSDRVAGRCLDFSRVVNTNSVPAMMEPCSSSSHQQWSRVVGPVSGFVRIVSSVNGVCLGVSAADRRRVVAARCQNIPNQHWKIAPANKDGRFIVTNQLTGVGTCLGIPESASLEAVGMSPCGNYAGQNWQMGG